MVTRMVLFWTFLLHMMMIINEHDHGGEDENGRHKSAGEGCSDSGHTSHADGDTMEHQPSKLMHRREGKELGVNIDPAQ